MKQLFESAADFIDSDMHIEYLIDGIIEKDTIGVMFGESGVGKSFLAIDIGLSVACGIETFNIRQSMKGVVLYVAGEGFGGIKRRSKAWQVENKMTKEDLKFFYLSKEVINLVGTDFESVIAEGQRLQELNSSPIALIIVDTLARHMEGDENSTKDMSDFIKGVSRLQSTFKGSVLMLLHHTGKSKKELLRGSSALKAAMDFEICVKRGNISFTKMKDAEAPGNLGFKLLPVEISSGQSGESITSCVVEYKEISSAGNRKKLSDSSDLGLKALSTACATKQQDDNDSNTVQIDKWREQFYSLRRKSEPEANQGTLKKSFQRVRDDLLGHGYISINGDDVTWHTDISGTRDKSET
jgi:hypothetical protein